MCFSADPIFKFFKGTVFTDAEYVLNPNPAFDGEVKFTSNFINKFGIGSGVGFWIDVQGFVIHFGLTTPFQNTFLPESEQLIF